MIRKKVVFHTRNIEYSNQKKHWIAEEALAISIYCSLLFKHDFQTGVLFSVNHGGDSDSTGSITGNILGLINGEPKIPTNWIEKLRYSDIVIR